MTIDIDYGGTESLVKSPLSYCKKPNIQYELKHLHLYVTRNDVCDIVEYLATKAGCYFLCWVHKQNDWVQDLLTVEDVKALILFDSQKNDKPEKYLRIFAARKLQKVEESEVDTIKKAEAFWKRQEIIQISSPTYIIFDSDKSLKTLLFYIDYSNEFVADEQIVRKSEAFCTMTSNLLDWLKTRFVSWRGPLAFDNPAEHQRVFGTKFKKD